MLTTPGKFKENWMPGATCVVSGERKLFSTPPVRLSIKDTSFVNNVLNAFVPLISLKPNVPVQNPKNSLAPLDPGIPEFGSCPPYWLNSPWIKFVPYCQTSK